MNNEQKISNERTLPDEAYLALQGLKEQSAAVCANNFKVDAEALGEAHAKMFLAQSWVNGIHRKLMNGKDGLTVDDIDEKWLESQFI